MLVILHVIENEDQGPTEDYKILCSHLTLHTLISKLFAPKIIIRDDPIQSCFESGTHNLPYSIATHHL